MGQSHIGYLDFDMEQMKVISISEAPVLSPGPEGTFDQNGLSIGCIIEINKAAYLYYVGWGNPVKGKFNNTVGMAYWNDSQGGFIKSANNPVLGLDETDALNLTYPFILKTEKQLTMWYGTNLSWGNNEHEMHHSLRRAQSSNGIDWQKDENIAVDLKHPNEFAIVRPTVIYDNGLYRMWYSYKGSSYKIGYAESEDALHWYRKDHLSTIENGSEGWESDEVCYPYVFEYKNRLYMLYNGNSYGKTGFGLAQWE